MPQGKIEKNDDETGYMSYCKQCYIPNYCILRGQIKGFYNYRIV